MCVCVYEGRKEISWENYNFKRKLILDFILYIFETAY